MRYRIIKLLFLFMAVSIILRLMFWQVYENDALTARAEKQRIITEDVKGLRGKVLFSDGSILVSNKPSYLVFIQPQLIKRDKKFNDSELNDYLKFSIAKIAKALWENKSRHLEVVDNYLKGVEIEKIGDDLFKKINPKLAWLSLGLKVDYDLKEQLEDLKIYGIGFDKSTTRLYPEGSSSAHLLGFVGNDIYGDEKGYFGLEGYYDGELKGKKGILEREKDALGLPILIGRFLNREPQTGKNLILTVNKSIQFILEQRLKEGLEKYGAKGASGIIMDPKTGNILAMASFPTYDPGNVTIYPKENFKNPIVADGYEPGSTFKTLVMAAGINEDVVKPDTICDSCTGPINLGGFTIRTWNNKYQEKLSMTDTIIHSNNTGMVFVAKKLGLQKLFNYIKRFGFGQLTGVDLQDEQSPSLRDFENWREIDLATASFGQGISVTAIQMIKAESAIANGGVLMEPHLVSAIGDGEKNIPIKPRVISQPITSNTANIIKEMMVQAVDKGEAQFYKKKYGLTNFKIAGKTGTAQIPVAGHYDPNKTIASFVGFAPADDPKFAMLIRYDQPSSSIYGADTAAPTFFDVAKELFLYYGIAPTE